MPVVGKSNLYALAVFDKFKNEVIIKLVNTVNKEKDVSLMIKGVKINNMGETEILTSANLSDENSFNNPKEISPFVNEIRGSKGKVIIKLKKNSLTEVKF
jgi:alpha-N-arabinofuranosidase